jgi:hypothetical protein
MRAASTTVTLDHIFEKFPDGAALQEIASFFVRLSHTAILVLIRRKAAHAMRSPGL